MDVREKKGQGMLFNRFAKKLLLKKFSPLFSLIYFLFKNDSLWKVSESDILLVE